MKSLILAAIAAAFLFGCTAEPNDTAVTANRVPTEQAITQSAPENDYASPLGADDLIGRWCYRPTPAIFTGIYTLAQDDDGNVALNEAYSDGSKSSKPMAVIGPNRYLDEESQFGDGVEILDSGELQLFNSEHPFSVASRLTDEPTDGECR